MNERKGTLVDDLNDFEGLCASMRPGKIVVITGEDGIGKIGGDRPHPILTPSPPAERTPNAG